MKESQVKPFLNIYFFHINFVNVTGLKFSFQSDIEPIKSKKCTIKIPEEFFKYEKGKRAASYTVYGGEEKKKLGKRKMFLYYGENNAYFQLDQFGNTYEYIFKDNNLNFEDINCTNKFDIFDTFDTKDRKRLVLLNFSDEYIKINGTPYNFYSNIVFNNLEIRNILSFQISEISQINKVYLIKEITDFPTINFRDLTNKEMILNNFIKEIKNLLLIPEKDLYKNKYNEIKNQFINSLNMCEIIKFLYLDGPKLYIMERMEEETSLDLEIYWKLNLYVYYMKKKECRKIKSFFKSYMINPGR